MSKKPKDTDKRTLYKYIELVRISHFGQYKEIAYVIAVWGLEIRTTMN